MTSSFQRSATTSSARSISPAPHADRHLGTGPTKTSAPEFANAERVCFFHQNDVFGVQGGIERYVSTLLDSARGNAALVSPPTTRNLPAHFVVVEKGPKRGPRWLRFALALVAQRKEIRAFLREWNVRVLEFSRPEYLMAGLLFAGKRVVTIHGTGPAPGHRLHRFVHEICCLIAAVFADRVQVVGRDDSGLPWIACRLLGRRLTHVQAWHADGFVAKPFPSTEGRQPLRVFYAGRIAPQKDPELLFSIVREAIRRSPGAYDFHYFGSDFSAFEAAGLAKMVTNHGLFGPQALAEAIANCHIGLLCSAFGEGSPYILVESLACGRPFVVSALPTLTLAYEGSAGISFVKRRDPMAFVDAMDRLGASIRGGMIDPFAIAQQVESCSQSRAAPELLNSLISLTLARAHDRL